MPVTGFFTPPDSSRYALRRVHGQVRDLLHVGVGHHAHGPTGVVVGAEVGIGEVLLFEQDLGEAAVGLVAFDHDGAGGVSGAVA